MSHWPHELSAERKTACTRLRDRMRSYAAAATRGTFAAFRFAIACARPPALPRCPLWSAASESRALICAVSSSRRDAFSLVDEPLRLGSALTDRARARARPRRSFAWPARVAPSRPWPRASTSRCSAPPGSSPAARGAARRARRPPAGGAPLTRRSAAPAAAGERLVALSSHGVEARPQFGEPCLELVNLQIVVLYGQQRGYIWMHEPSTRLKFIGSSRVETLPRRAAERLDLDGQPLFFDGSSRPFRPTIASGINRSISPIRSEISRDNSALMLPVIVSSARSSPPFSFEQLLQHAGRFLVQLTPPTHRSGIRIARTRAR